MTDLHEIAEHMRRMGETEDSIRYSLGEIPPPRPSLLEMFGEAMRPAPLNPPAIETGD